ncbi:MAG: hypothetical protein ABFD82_19775 [Syntrophaceae bacterium]
MPVKKKLLEKTWFIGDPPGTQSNADKNSQLAELLEGEWNDLAIVHMDRIEIGTSKGWKVTYRE